MSKVEVKEEVKVAALPQVPTSEYPKVFYNPVIPDERFFIEGDGYPRHFVAGKFIANNSTEEEGVRAALAVHGKGSADRWQGDDRKTQWNCKKCSFSTYNSEAQEDHEVRRQH